MGNTPSSARADREGPAAVPAPSASISPSHPSSVDTSAEACPVDHKTREAWLAQAKKNGQQLPPHPIPSTKGETDQTPPPKSTSPAPPSAIQTLLRATTKSAAPLATEREISTIPRALPPEVENAKEKARPANNEVESGQDKSGKWIYPSEKMFFEAMRRKNYDPKAEDMRSIVPIHNAVNERAWGEILQWEKGKGSEACGGPKLLSFSGLSKSLTPKARLNTLLGYQAPFDRHDWVVDRCGKRIEYVIDFYAGKDEGKPGKSLNFYLDVRPKVNTWEGVWMRATRLVGL